MNSTCDCHELMSVQCHIIEKSGINETIRDVIKGMLHLDHTARLSFSNVIDKLSSLNLEVENDSHLEQYPTIPRLSGK